MFANVKKDFADFRLRSDWNDILYNVLSFFTVAELWQSRQIAFCGCNALTEVLR
jgi:hypothetical protein